MSRKINKNMLILIFGIIFFLSLVYSSTWGKYNEFVYDEINDSWINDTLWTNSTTTTDSGTATISEDTDKIHMYVQDGGSSGGTGKTILSAINLTDTDNIDQVDFSFDTEGSMSTIGSIYSVRSKIEAFNNTIFLREGKDGYSFDDTINISLIKNGTNFSYYYNGTYQGEIEPTTNDINFTINTGSSGFAGDSSHASLNLYWINWTGSYGDSYVKLDNPVVNYVSSSREIDFSADVKVIGGATIQNISLWHNGTGTWERNQTKTITGTTNSTNFTSTISGATLWTIEACDSDGDCGFATENRTVLLDQNSPNVSIIYPNEDYISHGWYNSTYPVLDLNWSINDSNLDSCWYEYNNANTSVTCSDNHTTFQSVKNGLNTNNSITMWANDSAGNINSTTNYFYWNYSISNTTIFNDGCSTSHINYTEIPDGNYTYNVTVWFNDSSTSASNTTKTRVVYIDATYPLVSYTPNSDVTNESADFTLKNNIFVNASVTEKNEQNITFTLYKSSFSSPENQTTFTDGTRTINWTNLESNNMYFWNVTVCDKANNCNTTDTRRYGSEIINLTLNGSASNIDAELGTNITLNATTTNNQICIDIDHPSYGTNYTCVGFSTIFDIFINWFRKTTFGSGESSYEVNITGDDSNFNTSSFNLSTHRFDEMVNLSMNMSSSDYIHSPSFYAQNKTSIFDRVFAGYLYGSNIYLNQSSNSAGSSFNDYENVSFSSPGTSNIYFYLDDNANMKSVLMNVTGVKYGFEYYDDYSNNSYEDSAESNGAMIKGGLLVSGGTDKKNFTYDDYEDGSINTSLNIFAIANGYYHYTNQAGFTINNREEGGKLILDTNGLNALVTSGNVGSLAVNNYVYGNYSWLNIWTADDIYFDVEYDYDGYDQGSNGECAPKAYIKLGDAEVWGSPLESCEDSGSGNCYDYADSITPLGFHLERQTNDSWKVTINGSEHTHASHYSLDRCTMDWTYNWSEGKLSKNYTDRGGCTLSNSVTDLSNVSYISSLNWNPINQLVFYNYANIYKDESVNEGCDHYNSALVKIGYINQSLYKAINSTFVSSSVSDSSSDISAATLDTSLQGNSGGSVTYYMSADDGVNWESVSDGVEHSFSNTGRHIKYLYNFTVPSNTYLTNGMFMTYTNISTPQDWPSNITFDFGDDGNIDYTINGKINETNGSIQVNLTNSNLSNAFISSRLLTDNVNQYDHSYLIPLEVGTDTVGQLNIDSFNITYDPNPVKLNTTYIQNYLNALNWNINFTNISFDVGAYGGNITLNDLRFDYAGGNDTIEVKVHDPTYTNNVTRNITYFFSRWDYEFVPSYVDFLEFIPLSPTSRNVTPYGQSSSTSILNLTNYGYGGRKTNLSIYLNQSEDSSCVNLTMSLTNNKTDGTLLTNNTWYQLGSGIPYRNTSDIWMWADFGCSYSTWRYYNPYLYFRQCANDTICSEGVK